MIKLIKLHSINCMEEALICHNKVNTLIGINIKTTDSPLFWIKGFKLALNCSIPKKRNDISMFFVKHFLI